MDAIQQTTDRSRTPIRQAWRAACTTSLDLLLPPGCTFCHRDLIAPQDDIQLCQDCRVQLVNVLGPVCLQCACELPVSYSEDQTSCSNCQPLDFRFSSVVALGAYRMKTRTAMLQTKRMGGQPLAAALGRLLLSCRRTRLSNISADVVVPIPMHWTRRLQRGTNCPDTVAESLASGLGVTAAIHLLKRRRKTIRQTDLPQGSRSSNVRQVFRLSFGRKVQGARVLLVDDILTTGSTCSEAARALLSAGASDVAVAVIARATPWM